MKINLKEPEIIIPLSKGVNKLIMIGDPNQLPPVVKNKECVKLGMFS